MRNLTPEEEKSLEVVRKLQQKETQVVIPAYNHRDGTCVNSVYNLEDNTITEE